MDICMRIKRDVEDMDPKPCSTMVSILVGNSDTSMRIKNFEVSAFNNSDIVRSARFSLMLEIAYPILLIKQSFGIKVKKEGFTHTRELSR